MNNTPWGIILSESKRKPNAQRYMKKERFGKKEKTVRCSICGKPGTRLKFGKQTIVRCTFHIKQLNKKNQEVQVNKDTFVKASEL